MKKKNCIQRVTAFVLCLTLVFSMGATALAREDDWLLSLFLLAMLEEYGLYNVDDLLQLLDADSVEDLYKLYGGNYGAGSGLNGSDGAAYYDEDGYAIYLDERSGFYYGLYEDDTAYIVDYLGLGSGRSVDLRIPAYVEGYPVYDVYEYAFANVTDIASVTVAEGVMRISIGAFMNSSIKNITLPASVRYVEYDAFSGCTSLQWVSFSEGLEFIGACAFMDCISLQAAMLPDSLTQIDFDAFSGCSALRQARLGAGLTSMTGNIFSYCPSLSSLQIAPGNRYFTNNDGLLINSLEAALLRYDASVRRETSFTVPDGIRVIGEMCFAHAEALTQITLPDSVVALEDYALWGCVGIKTIDLGKVETIGYNAVNVNSLREIALPDSIRSMDNQAFCLRSDAADIGGARTAYATPGTLAYSGAVTNGFVVRPLSEYQPPEEMVVCAHLTPGFDQVNYGAHPHTFASCALCGEQLMNFPAEGVEISTCNQCFSVDGFYQDRAVAMSQITVETYAMTGKGSGINRLEIADDRGAFNLPTQQPVTESLVLVSQTADGELIVTISFEGSRDLIDDWVRDAAATAHEGIHVGVSSAVSRFLLEYVYSDDVKMDVQLDGISGKYSVGELLEMVRENPRAHLRIAGHSYGGGLAQAFTHYATDMLDIPLEQIETYTFASLVPFSHDFVLEHPEYATASIYNYINDEDFVTCIGVTSERALASYHNADNVFQAVTAYADVLAVSILSLGENAFNLGSGIGTNTLHTTNVCTAGFTLAGAYAGKIIYLDKSLASGAAHNSETYLALVKMTQNPPYTDARALVQLFAGDVRQVEADFESLYESVDSRYNIAVLHGGSWYLIDSVPQNCNYFDLCERWDALEAQYRARYNAEDMKLCLDSDSVIGFAFNAPPAGDALSTTINGVTAYPIAGDRLYDKDFFENWVEERSWAYTLVLKIEEPLTAEEEKAKKNYEALKEKVNGKYNIAVLYRGSWYLIDEVPYGYDYFDLCESWDELKDQYCKKLGAEDMKLCLDSDAVVGFAYNSPPAGDVFYTMINGIIAYPTPDNRLYDKAYFEKLVENRYNAYMSLGDR